MPAKKLTTEEFIEKSIKIHGNKYDYSLSEYTRSNHIVKIVCPIHGVFEQQASRHLLGCGCQKCGRKNNEDSRRITKERFLNRVLKKFGNLYSYTNMEYIDFFKDIKIYCNRCGKYFYKTPDHFLKGNGCDECRILEEREKSAAQFFKKSKKIHNNFYDYSESIYISSQKKIKIICPTHGKFYQIPNSHVKGRGCPKCNCAELITTKSFIERSNSIHSNKYDYSLTEYKNAKNKVKIICPVNNHGLFIQEAYSHLSGCGCPKCADIDRVKSKIKTREIFLKEAKSIHGEKYDYSIVEYKNSNEKISIICPEHGVFEQTPNSHIQGRGCMKCGYESSKEAIRISFEEFKRRAVEKHGNLFEYLEESYIDMSKDMKIICPVHGVFTQMPINHISGKGCPKCSGKNKTTEDFIKECKSIHGNRYDYSKVVYKKSIIKVDIICREHGVFRQTPNDHLSGYGCPKCNYSKAEIYTEEAMAELGIKFISQKRFPECRRMRPLPFDFYLPEHNIAIECQGQQHYKPVPQWGGKKVFIENNIRDMIKKNYCKREGIRLLEIPYWHFYYSRIKKYLEEVLVE